MRFLFCWVLFWVVAFDGHAQRYQLSSSVITFFSDAAIEDIEATNKKTSGIFDVAKSEIAFSVPINQFQFDKKLMQQHFNEKYLESEKYPTSTFSGFIEGYNADVSSQEVTAKGKLKIHGVTQEVKIPGTIEKKGDGIIMKAKFIVKLEDYKVKIPQILWQNIAEQVEVTVEFVFNSN